MSEAVTTISTALRRAVEEAREKGECTVLCSDALLLSFADRVEYIENEHLAALRAQEQNEPLTCEGCKLNGLPHHPALRSAQCSCCSRESGRTDNYEPKDTKGAHQ